MGFRQSRIKQRQNARLSQEEEERRELELAKQELFSFYQKASETWQSAGALHEKVDGAQSDAQQCYINAASLMERAGEVLETAIGDRLFKVKAPELEEDRDDTRKDER